MPCHAKVIRQKVKKPVEIPSERELRDALGAKDHVDLHRILDGMSGDEIAEKLKQMEKRKRKRLEAAARYIAAEHR